MSSTINSTKYVGRHIYNRYNGTAVVIHQDKENGHIDGIKGGNGYGHLASVYHRPRLGRY